MRGQLFPGEKQYYIRVISQVIEFLKSHQYEEIDLTQHAIVPCEVDEILKELGWDRDTMEQNGWEGECWCNYSHPNYKFTLVLNYEAWTFNMKLYRGDIDDEDLAR